jgi:hypothetical protein
MRFRSIPLFAIVLFGACHDKGVELKGDSAQVFGATAYDVSPPLRDLAALPRPLLTRELDEMEPVRPNPHVDRLNRVPVTPSADIVQGLAGLVAIPPPVQDFEGQGAGLAGTAFGGYPPDTDGAVGPNHYVQVVNTSVAVFSKTGTVMMGPMSTSMVWTGFPGICATDGFGDGVVRYDQLADRWVISQFAFTLSGGNPVAPFIQCIAISTTGDPTGTYARYQYSFNSDLNDYPKIALWPDGYYITYNMFADASSFSTSRVCAMDRTKMLAADPNATTQCFDTGPNYFGILVADLDGKTKPPAGAPAHMIALDTSTSLAYWQLHIDFATPANSTLSATPQSIAVSNFTTLCNGGGCVPAKGGETLGSLGDRAMNRFVYRTFNDHESLLLSHSVSAGTSGGVRWYEVRDATTPTLFQSGTFAPDTTYRWMPSIAMDAVGEIALLYTQSSSTSFPSIKFTARAATDPLGTMGYSEGTLQAGTGAQKNGGGRWGDYASLNIDPTDDCTFWATHEYYATSTANNVWSTRIGSFVLPGCSTFAIAKPSDETVAQGSSMTYPITTTTTAGTAQTVAMTATGLPTGVTATFNPPSIQSGATTQITLSAGSDAALGSATYQVVGTGTVAALTNDVALTVTPVEHLDAGISDGGNSGGGGGGGCCQTSNGEQPLGTFALGTALVFAWRRRRARA